MSKKKSGKPRTAADAAREAGAKIVTDHKYAGKTVIRIPASAIKPPPKKP